jgi:hypothetical protein
VVEPVTVAAMVVVSVVLAGLLIYQAVAQGVIQALAGLVLAIAQIKQAQAVAAVVVIAGP